VVNGWAIADNNGLGNPQTVAYETQTDVGGPDGAALTFTLTQNFGSSFTLGRFRLSVTQDNRGSFADGMDSNGDVTANWFVLAPTTAMATNGAMLTIAADGSILASGANPVTTVYTVTAATDVNNITGIRLEVLNDASLPDNGPGRHGSSNLVLQEFAVDFVELPAANADFDEDSDVDGNDLARWRTSFAIGATHMQGDTNADADVDGADFLVWQRQLGRVTVATVVPEPRAVIMLLGGMLALIRYRTRAIGPIIGGDGR
jgi:hypothetical protein